MSFLTDLLDYDINFATLIDSSSKSVCDKNENAAHVKSSDKIICGSSNSEIFQNFRLRKKSFFPNFSVSLPQNVTLTSKLPGVGDLKDIKSKCATQQVPRRAFGSVILAFVVVGLLGNILIAAIILILKEYRKSVANWYILQLALADTLFLFTLPFTAASELSGKWVFEVPFCKIKEAVLFVNYYASIYFLVVMSFDRYLAVTKAFASSKLIRCMRTMTAALVISAIGWVISIIISTPLFMYSNVDRCKKCLYTFPTTVSVPTDTTSFPLDAANFHIFANNLSHASQVWMVNKYTNELHLQYCTIRNDSFATWLYANFVIAFCLPLALICVFYGMILSTIMSTRAVGNVDSQRSYRRRVTMIVLSLVALFVVSWLPWYVVNLTKVWGISVSYKVCENLAIAIRLMAYLNSVLNPYFYSFLGARFGERLSKATTRIRHLGSSSHSRVASREQRRRRTNNSTSNSVRAQRPQIAALAGCSVTGRGNPYPQSTNELDDGKTSVMNRTERTML